MSGRAALALASALVLGACVQVRLLTYPAEFVWLGEKDVQGVMHRMAERMIRLDTLVAAPADAEPLAAERRRRAVDAELRGIEELAATLAVGAVGIGEQGLPRTNHLLIDEHIDDFLGDVARARRFVAEEPPNYYAAGRLGGSCSACHRWRADTT